MPSWIKVLQFKFPYDDNILKKKIVKFISKNPDIEIRLFGLFASDKKEKNLKTASKLLSDFFPNTYIIFHTNEISRIEENIQKLIK